MTEQVSVKEALRRIREEASAARAFFHTWRALDSARGEARLRYTMNNHHYVDFFRVAIVGSFRLIFVSLGKIYDKRSDSINLKYLANCLSGVDRACLIEVCQRHEPVIVAIRSVRNKAMAHNDSQDADTVFQEAEITLDQIENLIDATCEAINAVATKPEYGFNRISGGQRNEKAVGYLLDVLVDSRFQDRLHKV